MASNINPNNINGNFPVAGQDNPSQGFRDNFNNTSINLGIAAEEISDLQAKSVLISPLAGSTINNNFAGTPITAAQLRATSETINDLGAQTGGIILDYATANIQKITTAGDISISFANFPTAGLYGRMILWLTVTDSNYSLQIGLTSPGVTSGAIQIAGIDINSGIISFDTPGEYLFEFCSQDAGENIIIRDLTRNYNFLTGSYIYYNPLVSPSLLIGYGDNLKPAEDAERGQDAVSALGSYNSVSIGNIFQANIESIYFDSGMMAGYTMTSARGNLTTGNVLPVLDSDLLGYIGGQCFSGNGGGNVFQQVSSIGFFAKGVDVENGLGGNIGIFTVPDSVPPGLHSKHFYQAIGIENDQTTHIMGNVILGRGVNPTTSSYVPATCNSGGTPGQIAWSSPDTGSSTRTGYLYICDTPNRWLRTTLQYPW